MSILAWIVLGLIAGFIASQVVNKSGEGLILDIVLGIVGAFVGGYLFTLFGAAPVTGPQPLQHARRRRRRDRRAARLPSARRRTPPHLKGNAMKIISLLLAATLVLASSVASEAGRVGSHRVGGHGPNGRGSHYVGGHKSTAVGRFLHRHL